MTDTNSEYGFPKELIDIDRNDDLTKDIVISFREDDFDRDIDVTLPVQTVSLGLGEDSLGEGYLGEGTIEVLPWDKAVEFKGEVL